MKIWLDDQYDDEVATKRKPPKGYIGVHTVNEAKRLIEEAEEKGEPIEHLSLDNDLGPEYSKDGGEGHCLLDWLIERGTFYDFDPHSQNVNERDNMLRTKARFWPKNY